MSFKNFFRLVTSCLVGLLACRQPASRLEKLVVFSNYPSGSALAYLDGYLYLMGDDAVSLLKLDTDFSIKDSFTILKHTGRRLDKANKPDLEAMAVVMHKKKQTILMLGSGSADSIRSVGWLNGPTGEEQLNLKVFYDRLKSEGIKELNIEGLATYPGGIILANRGNKTYRKNSLIFTDKDFFSRQDSADIKITAVGVTTDSAEFNGISGADYSTKFDKLFLSVSTENTYDSYADGSIGKSYLWIINDISRKKYTHINPDQIIDLEELDTRFKGQKIEAVCVIAETRKQFTLVLAADNDNGKTTLFKITLKK